MRRSGFWDGSSLAAGPLGGADPLGFAAGDANLYRYVGSDPTGMVDPSGLEGERDEGTVKGISRSAVKKVRDMKDDVYRRDVSLPGEDKNTYNGPCAHYAKEMTDRLRNQKIDFRLHFYDVDNGSTVQYTDPEGNAREVKINATHHFIVEVGVGGEKTLKFDAGAGDPKADHNLENGNVDDPETGVIDDKNKELKDEKGHPIMRKTHTHIDFAK